MEIGTLKSTLAASMKANPGSQILLLLADRLEAGAGIQQEFANAVQTLASRPSSGYQQEKKVNPFSARKPWI